VSCDGGDLRARLITRHWSRRTTLRNTSGPSLETVRAVKRVPTPRRSELLIRRWNQDVDKPTHAPLVLVLDHPGNLGIQGVVLAEPHVITRLQTCPALPNQDGAPRYELPVESLDAQSLCVGIAAVARTSQSFFVCHFSPYGAGRSPSPMHWELHRLYL